MARTKSDQFKNWKVVFFWVLGSICALVASLIAGNAEMDMGTSMSGFMFSLSVSFLLFLVAGILWISVAIAIKELEEK